VLEAARALSKLNLKPKRTIRFVLFTGEEEGLVGVGEIREAHKNELESFPRCWCMTRERAAC